MRMAANNYYNHPRICIVNTRMGPSTADVEYQTVDGRWWKKWDGIVKTGQEVRQLKFCEGR